MKYTKASIEFFLLVIIISVCHGFTFESYELRFREVSSISTPRDVSLSMKFLNDPPTSHIQHSIHTAQGTQLRFKNLVQEEEEVEVNIHTRTWVNKWVEEISHFSWPSPKKHNTVASNHGSGDDGDISRKEEKVSKGGHKIGNGVHYETDPELKDSLISHFSSSNREHLLDDIEILPHASPMFYDPSAISIANNAKANTDTDTDIAKHDDNEATRGQHRAKRYKEKNRRHKNRFHSFGRRKAPNMGIDTSSLLIEPMYRRMEKVSTDQAQLAVSIASTIETPRQWVEFCENVGGLKPILQCIHNVAEEINVGRATATDDEYMNTVRGDGDPLSTPGDVNRFSVACSACKVLRDLLSKDQYWASAITDDILKLNQDGTIIADLVLLMSHTNEAERLNTKKVWRKRRKLRRQGNYSTMMKTRKQRRDSKRRCRLYINQLLLGMAIASDQSIKVFRDTPGLLETVRSFSSYTKDQKIRRRWIKYPFEVTKRILNKVRRRRKESSESAFIAAASMESGILGEVQATSNKLLGALGYNVFVPKTPGQKGLRILSLDGGGTRGVASISIMKAIVDSLDGVEVCDAFDMIAGTSTGAIIAFLVGLRRESNEQAKQRYDELIEKIFVKGHLSAPMLLLTTATYSETPFKHIMQDVLGDYSMLDSRADPRVPLVFAVSAKMSSTTSKLSLFRNYNYPGGEKQDNFVVAPDDARLHLGFPIVKGEVNGPQESISGILGASRHEGSFRILQRAALRATTAAPTVFKPVQMGTDMYSDGGLVASNPAAIAIHEARTLYPDIPIEMVVSVGTGEFVSKKVSLSFGWDGIISQIVKSATETAKTHWVLQDILGQKSTTNADDSVCNTKYYRFDPVIGQPEDFPIDGTDPENLEKLYRMSTDYMSEPEQEKSLEEIARIVKGKNRIF